MNRLRLLKLIVILGMVGAGYYYSHRFGPKVTFGQGEVYYAKGATRADAVALGQFLQRTQYFGERKVAVRVTRHGEAYVVGFVVKSGVWDSVPTCESFNLVGIDIATDVYHDSPTTVQMCDRDFTVKKSLAIELTRKQVYGDHCDLYYSPAITDDEARQTSGVLASVFPGAKAVTTTLTKPQDRRILSIVMRAGAWNDPSMLSFLTDRARQVDEAVFHGAPMELHLIDGRFEVHKVVTL